MKTLEEMLEVMTAYRNGGLIEFKSNDKGSSWEACIVPCWDWIHFDYRVRPIPEVKQRLLGPADFPPGTLVRAYDTQWALVTEVDNLGFWTAMGRYSYEEVSKHHRLQRSYDNGKTWV